MDVARNAAAFSYQGGGRTVPRDWVETYVPVAAETTAMFPGTPTERHFPDRIRKGAEFTWEMKDESQGDGERGNDAGNRLARTRDGEPPGVMGDIMDSLGASAKHGRSEPSDLDKLIESPGQSLCAK